MDKEQEELQFLGLFGIWRESFKTIDNWRQIFFQLSILILPLSFIYLIHTETNFLFFTQRIGDSLTHLAFNTDTEAAKRALSRDLPWYLLIQVSFIFFFLVLYLLSTAAVVYTVACIFVGKDVSFKQVMRVVPKVWKRLMVTLLCVMAIMFIYNLIAVFFFAFIVHAYLFDQKNAIAYMVLGAILFALYLSGVCYMGVVWQLANTVSVLEDSYGFQALRRSEILMKGKMGISVGIFFIVNFCVEGANQLFKYLVLDPSNVGSFGSVGFGGMSLWVLCIVNLVGLVVHTIFYLVCKSYHHEQIDKSALADHLQVYHGQGYLLLKHKDKEMDQV